MKRQSSWVASALLGVGTISAWTIAQSPKNKPDVKQPPKENPAASDEPMADVSESDAKEKAVADRFQKVLDTTPRRGTALDRLYGYHVERGSLEKLLQGYDERIKADPKDGKAWLIKGLIESQRGKDALAVAAYRKAEELLPENAIASYYLGQSLVLVGQPEAAAQAFERSITRKPNRNDLLDVFQALGRVYQRSQRPEKALETWNRLEKLYPDDARVQEQITTTLIEEGQFAQALPRLVKLAAATEDKYRQATFLMDIADLKVKLKKTPEALADFEKLLSDLNPESWLYRDVRRRIEEVFLKNDDLAGLAKYYEKWLEKNPTDVEAVARLAKNLVAQGRAPDARGWLEKGIVAAPGNKSLRQALIDQYAAEQNFTAAAGQYEVLAKNDPGNPDILRDWGRLIMRDTAKPEAERKAAAVAIWKKILEKKPTDPVITSQVADLLRGANISDEAIALYKKAIELAPNAAQYREYLGEYYHSLKKSEEALATWRPIADGTNRNSKNLNRLAEVFAGFGYRKQAIEAMAEAIKLEGNDFSMRMVMAEFLHGDSRNDDALKEIDQATKLISNPEEAEAILLAQIKIYQAMEKLGDQIDSLQKEIDAGKDATAERLLRLARFYEANRQAEKATETIAKAAEKDPKSVPVLVAAARMHEAGGNLLAASETNRQLASLDRRFRSEYLQAVAKVEQRLGRRDQAMQAGRDLLAASPGNPEVYKFFAELCFQLGDDEEGFESLRRSVRANPSDPAGLITLANSLVERFRQGEAIELFWRAFDKTTELEARLGLIDRLAGLYLENNQFDKLIERLERERLEAEKAREFTMCIAQAYQTAGDLGTARAQLERLLTENTRDAGLLSQLAQLCETEGDLALALKYQRQLVAAAPSNIDHQLKLAQILTRSGGADEAAEIWVKLVSGDSEPHRTLSSIDQLINANRHDSALAILTRLLAQKPGNWELLYREGAVLMAMGKKAEAMNRFQAILASRLQDDDLGEQAKNSQAQAKKKAKLNPKAAALASVNSSRFSYDDSAYPPLMRRIGSVYEIRQAVGMESERYYGNQQRAWAPSDFGSARMACMGWLYEQAREKGEQAEYQKKLRAAKDQAGADLRNVWDYAYFLTLRNDRKEAMGTTEILAKSSDPAGSLAYLYALTLRQSEANRYASSRGRDAKEDRTPPLPPEQLAQALVCFNKVRQTRPEWANEMVKPILEELKRAKKVEEAKAIYESILKGADTVQRIQAAMTLALEREDLQVVLSLFDKLEKVQGPVPVASRLSQLPTRQASQTIVTIMGRNMDAKKPEESRKVMDHYLTMSRKQNLAAPRSASTTSSRQSGQGYVYTYAGKGNRSYSYKQLPFPNPNEYYDQPALQVLYGAYDLHQKADLASDLIDHFRKQSEAASGAEKLYSLLALGYINWWMEQKDVALNLLTQATQAAPSDHALLLEVADLREKNNEFGEALRLVDSITPLDHQMMLKREEAAMRLAERTGNVERARESANRLFGMRLDSDRQLELAGRMHQLGMHELAETVLGRAQRQAGNKSATLLRLMSQYQSQNQLDMAVQIARQVLRKPVSSTPNPRGGDEGDPGRMQAITVLARSGQLKELIERAEAQLKSSPNSVQIHQTLMEYYRSANDREKQKATALKIALLKPEDAKLRFAMAQELQNLGDTKNAIIQYREAIKRDPILLQNGYWQLEQLFVSGGQYEELSKMLDEIDLRKIGQAYYVGNMVYNMMQSESSRQMGLKLFKRAWEAFPSGRSELLRYVSQGRIPDFPEVFEFLKDGILPREDSEGDPWALAVNVTGYDGEGRLRTAVGQMLDIARKQHRLPQLRTDVEALLAKKPDWLAGQALRAVIDIQSDQKERGLKDFAKVMEQNRGRIPPMACFVLAQELEYYAGAEPIAVKALESAAEDLMNSDDSGQTEFEYNPVRRLVWWYQQLERMDDARNLMRRYMQAEPIDPGYGGGYWQYRLVSGRLSAARAMVALGDPVEAIRQYGIIMERPEDLAAAKVYYGQGSQFEMQLENGLKEAIKSLNNETLPAAMGVLLKARTEKNKPALDLILTIESGNLAKTRISSVFCSALKAASSNENLRKESMSKLAEIAVAYPKDPSVRVASAYAKFLGTDEKAQAAALDDLVKLLDEAPLEVLPPFAKANSRQREQAKPHLGLWLVARECLVKGKEKLHEPARKIAARALVAAQRQNELIMSQAVLREWGQLEFDLGETAKGEEKWAEMLKILLPKPAATRLAGAPGAAPIPGTMIRPAAGVRVAPAATPRPAATAPAAPARPATAVPPPPPPPANEAPLARPQVSRTSTAPIALAARESALPSAARLNAIARSLPTSVERPQTLRTHSSYGRASDSRLEFVRFQQKAAMKAARAPSSSAAMALAPPGSVITIDNFQPIYEYARVTADRKLGGLSIKSMKEALKAGPPTAGKQDDRGGGSYSVTMINGVQYYVRQDRGTQQTTPDVALANLVPMWRKIGVPAQDIYEVLLLAVMPDARPAEVFLSSAIQPTTGRYYTVNANGSLVPATIDPVESVAIKDISKLLIEAAVAANKTDELAKKAEGRLAQPLGELPAMVLLFHLALEQKDEAKAGVRLAALGQRLKKDSLATTRSYVAAAATVALDRPALESAARTILADVSASYNAANNIGESITITAQVLDRLLAKNDTAAAKKLLDGLRDLANKTHSNEGAMRNRLGALYLKAGFMEEALGEYAYALDFRSASADLQQRAVKADPVGDSVPLVVKGLLEMPAPKRYELLKTWTLPSTSRKSIRYFVGPIPQSLPLPEFAKLPPWPKGPTVGTVNLLIDAARDAGKLEELTAAADQAIKDKIESAEMFRLLVYLSQGKGKTIEADVKAHLEALHKRLTEKPKESASAMRRVRGEQGTVPFAQSEIWIAELALKEPALAAAAEKVLAPMLEKARQSQLGVTEIQAMQDQIALAKLAAPEAAGDYLPAGWINLSSDSAWFAQDGLLGGDGKGKKSQLLFGSPVGGTFEFSVDSATREAAFIAYGGLKLAPFGGSIQSTLGSQSNRVAVSGESSALENPGHFYRLTVKVSPKKLEILVNGKLWYEDVDPAPTSPWILLEGQPGRRPVYRNFKLTGKPEVPDQVKLVQGDYLDGWHSPYTSSSAPNRIQLRQEAEMRKKGLDRFGRKLTNPQAQEEEGPKPVYDWQALNGELQGRKLEAAAELGVKPSHLAYRRPMLEGDTFSCEFFYQPGAVHVHPSLGRLVFLLEPEGVQWYWIKSADDSWLGLNDDKGVAAPAAYSKTPGKLPLKTNDWNALKLSVAGGTFKVELNGANIQEGPIPAGLDRDFGFFHWLDRTQSRVRNVALAGKWSKTPAEGGFDTKPVSAQVARARRDLIGERHYTEAAEGLLASAKALPPAQRLKMLTDWVLPNENRPVFQLGGMLVQRNVLGAEQGKELAAGRRILLPSRFDSPVLEMVALAKETNQLAELKAKVAGYDAAKSTSLAKTHQTAILALIAIAEGNEAESKAKLGELKKAAEAMAPSAAGHERWPLLLAIYGAIEKPGLVPSAYEIAVALNLNVEKAMSDNISFEDRDWWFANVRFARAKASALLNPDLAGRAFGDNAVFKNWTAASGVGAMSRNGIASAPHWRLKEGALIHEPGFNDFDYLLFNTPLRGDFTVAAKLHLGDWKEASVRYGGVELRLDSDRKSFKLARQVSEPGMKMMISPPLKDEKAKVYDFKLAVAGGKMKFLIDGQQVHEETVGPLADPWLAIRCPLHNTGVVEGLTITGSPTVPESISLTLGGDFPMWRNYYASVPVGPAGRMGQMGYSAGNMLIKRGEEMYAAGGKPQPNFQDEYGYRFEQGQERFPESAYYYQRPMAEDGTIEYDFYYSPEKAMVHPMLDRLVFLLEPEGVKLHTLTDASYEKSRISPTNAVDEPANRRGSGKLPLKPKEWNRLKLSVSGDTVKISLNGTEVYEKAIEPTNQRFFGLFHYRDKTEARVRSMTYAGQWPKKVPALESLFEERK